MFPFVLNTKPGKNSDDARSQDSAPQRGTVNRMDPDGGLEDARAFYFLIWFHA